jgi:hypothetical protein
VPQVDGTRKVTQVRRRSFAEQVRLQQVADEVGHGPSRACRQLLQGAVLLGREIDRQALTSHDIMISPQESAVALDEIDEMVTSCAFGGADLGDLYITSLRTGMSNAERRASRWPGHCSVAGPGSAACPPDVSQPDDGEVQ